MTSAEGVMSIILLETAVGGSAILWASGTWGAVRRGFFLLSGVTIALCALGAWAIARTSLEGPAAPRAVQGLAVFAGLAVAWQVLLLIRQKTAAQVVGIAAAGAGLIASALYAQTRENPTLAVTELMFGSLFLGSTMYGLLLGHWYLVERRLDKGHMVRGAWWYIAGVVAAGGAAILSGQNPAPEPSGLSPLLSVPGFTVLLAGGLVAICALIAGFVWKLAHEGGRSIQAATGYFYLAVIMAFAAEMSTKVRF